MRRSSIQQSIKQFASSPTASGGLSRLAANRLRRAGIKLEPLLSRIGLTVDQIDDPKQRIDAGGQIAFLDLAAEALKDDSGLHLTTARANFRGPRRSADRRQKEEDQPPRELGDPDGLGDFAHDTLHGHFCLKDASIKSITMARHLVFSDVMT
jgi:hypothetical protein